MAEEIINYIKENLAKGVPQDQIRQSLLTSGWKQADIDAAFLQLDAPPSSLPPFPIKPSSAQNQPLKPKEENSCLADNFYTALAEKYRIPIRKKQMHKNGSLYPHSHTPFEVGD